MKMSVGKCSVWVYGSVLRPSGWEEGIVLEVGEGFKNRSEAEAWGLAAMRRLGAEPGKSPARFRIGPAY